MFTKVPPTHSCGIIRIQNEAKSLSNVAHDNVPKLLGEVSLQGFRHAVISYHFCCGTPFDGVTSLFATRSVMKK